MSYSDGNLNFYYYGDAEATAGTGKGAQIFPDILNAARTTGQKFEDPFFPANDDSLGTLEAVQIIRKAGGVIVWARPTEIAQGMLNGSPPIFQGNLNEFGVNQGMVGDCWFLSVLADAALKPACFNTIIPADNKTLGFDSGVFHFRFWCKAKWVDIVIDDRLPCVAIRGAIRATVFCKPTADGGFWAPLFEKAYAKLYGQYGHIDRGFGTDAMLDFTGGYIEELYPSDPYLTQKMKDLKKADGFIALQTQQTVPVGLRVPHDPSNPGLEDVSREGIVASHDYSFIDIQDVTYRNDPSKVTTLLRIRNPWGNATEWKGDFSDSDPDGAWDKVTPDLRKPKRDDGEFWISFDSFKRYLDVVDTCRWSDQFRGDQNGKVDGYSFFSLKGNFSAEASGPCNGQSDLRGKGGVYVYLKSLNPNAPGAVNNCSLSTTLMYLNYSKSGNNPHIPGYLIYLLWAPGYVKPESDDFFNNANVAVNFPTAQTRHMNVIWPSGEGTALIVPWLAKPAVGDNPPFLLRILAEGDVFTL